MSDKNDKRPRFLEVEPIKNSRARVSSMSTIKDFLGCEYVKNGHRLISDQQRGRMAFIVNRENCDDIYQYSVEISSISLYGRFFSGKPYRTVKYDDGYTANRIIHSDIIDVSYSVPNIAMSISIL